MTLSVDAATAKPQGREASHVYRGACSTQTQTISRGKPSAKLPGLRFSRHAAALPVETDRPPAGPTNETRGGNRTATIVGGATRRL
ncbi:hypothetical protein GQ55_4G339500 [Panicum hallii var. hallii]|uniref:Uncharacterized protein n=1 Tax=Panicum hallii var. hallii TaxID=1504633 RepID=A0A2T7E2Z9_9POAL|nr:hypothetical protein GQ55_4G339500 [Panicum hallii var. hallii]